MSYNRFLELLSRKKSGALTLPEQKELNRFLETNPEYGELTDMVDDLFERPFNTTEEVSPEYIEQRWHAIHRKISGHDDPAMQRRPPTRMLYYVAAASVITFLAAWYFFFNNSDNDSVKQHFVSTKKGSKTNLELPDGTQVWLNADSRIEYDKNYGKGSREIVLTGEAYFDVVHDAGNPFIVHTHEMDIKVLGTVFNVKAYDSDKEIETTLLKGSVEVSLKNDGTRKILLKPNEKLTITHDTPDQVINRKVEIAQINKPPNDSVATEVQWVTSQPAFRNERLDELALQFSRWYGIDVEIQSEALKEMTFTGVFEQDPLQVMESLKLAGGFSYKLQNNKITIVP